MSDNPSERVLPLRIFYSYAQEDEALCRTLEKHLSLLRRENTIIEWSQRMIPAGVDRADAIDQNLRSASLILLLISPDFLASDYCYSTDMQGALERHASGTALVIPILLRPVDWKKAPFAHLQYLPRNAQPVTMWSNQDRAFEEVASEIRSSIEGLLTTAEMPTSRIPSFEAQPAPSSVPSGRLLFKYDAHADTPITVDWSPDGTRIASGGLDNTVHIWEAASGHHLLTYRHPKNFFPDAVGVVRWSPDNRRLASGRTKSGKIYIWDAKSGQNVTIYEDHTPVLPGIWSLAWSPDGRYIASANGTFLEALAHIWDANTGKKILRITGPDKIKGSFPGYVAWSSDGTRIAARWEKAIYICHAYTGKYLLTFREHNGFILDIAWSPDNQWVISAQPQKIIVWNATTGVILLSYEKHLGPIRGIALSSDGKYVASASEDRTVHIWELLTGRQCYIYEGHSDYVASVTWSPDGTRIASASGDKSVHVWRTLLYEQSE